MDDALDPLEILWSALLSRQPELVQEAFTSLDKKEQKAVRQHLERMAKEPGWHEEQAASARAALEAIQAIEE